ncbi:hypothetical protein EC988_009990 [Linderina pennispora]|nr:hypothetical protein EC988_009990 [Linderina pennispora]
MYGITFCLAGLCVDVARADDAGEAGTTMGATAAEKDVRVNGGSEDCICIVVGCNEGTATGETVMMFGVLETGACAVAAV